MPPSPSATTISIGGRSLLMIGFRQYLIERALDNDRYCTRLSSLPITRPYPVGKSSSTSSVSEKVTTQDVWGSHHPMETEKCSFLDHETNASMNAARSERDWHGLDVKGSKTSTSKRHGGEEGKNNSDVLGGSEGVVYPDTNARTSMNPARSEMNGHELDVKGSKTSTFKKHGRKEGKNNCDVLGGLEGVVYQDTNERVSINPSYTPRSERYWHGLDVKGSKTSTFKRHETDFEVLGFPESVVYPDTNERVSVKPSYTSTSEMAWCGLDVKGSNTSNFKRHAEEETITNCDIHKLGGSKDNDHRNAKVHVENGSKTYKVHRKHANDGSLSSHFDNGTHRAKRLMFSASNDETELEDRHYNTAQTLNVLDSDSGHVLFHALDYTLSSSFQYQEGSKDASEFQENGANGNVVEFPVMNLRYTSSPKTSRPVERGMDEARQDFDDHTTDHTYARIGGSTITEDSNCDMSNTSCSNPSCECNSQNLWHIYARIDESAITENSACGFEDMSTISCSSPTCEDKSQNLSHIYAQIGDSTITENSACGLEDMSNISCSSSICPCKPRDHSHIYALIDENAIIEDPACGRENVSNISCSSPTCPCKLRDHSHIYALIDENAIIEDAACGRENVSNISCSSPTCESQSRDQSHIYALIDENAITVKASTPSDGGKNNVSKYLKAYENLVVRKFVCQENSVQFPNADYCSKSNTDAMGYLSPRSDMYLKMDQYKDILPAKGNNATYPCDVNDTTYKFPSASSYLADRNRSKDNSPAKVNNATFLRDVNEFPSATSHSTIRDRSKDNSPADVNNATFVCDVNEFPSATSHSTIRDRSKDNPPAEDNNTTYLCDMYDSINQFPAANPDSRTILTVPQPIRSDHNYCSLLPPPTFSCRDCLQNLDDCSCSLSSWSCQAQEGSPSRSINSSSPSFGPGVLGHNYSELEGPETGLDGATSTLNLIEPSYVRIGDTIGGVVNPYCVVDVPMYAETGFSDGIGGIDTYSTASTSVAVQMHPDDHARLVAPSPTSQSDQSKRCFPFFKSVQFSVGILYVTLMLLMLSLVVYAIYRFVTWLS